MFTYLPGSAMFCGLGTVKGAVFDLRFSSDNNVNGSGFYATYQVFETTPNSSVLLPAGPHIQGYFLDGLLSLRTERQMLKI